MSMEAYQIINNLLGNTFAGRLKDIQKAEAGDYSGISNAEIAAFQYLKDNATDQTLVRCCIYNLVFGIEIEESRK